VIFLINCIIRTVERHLGKDAVDLVDDIAVVHDGAGS
jgi:hypothetical protein